MNAPPSFSSLQLEVTLDGKKADFAEGMFSSTRRYLAYTRKVPSSVRVSLHTSVQFYILVL